MTLLESIFSIFGGATAALLAVGFLFRSFIRLQVDKQLERHSHELALQLHHRTIGLSRYEQDRVDALKTIYLAIANLSRASVALHSLVHIDRRMDYRGQYFLCLQRIFSHLAKTLTEISSVYMVLDTSSVYINDETERFLMDGLDSIHKYYTEVLARCQQVQKNADELVAFSEATQPIELGQLVSEVALEWARIVEPSKQKLKLAMRNALSAG
jgi:hypothetical protein